ncbi:MAG: adenylate kinase [Acidimicrobiales bacterium]
MALHLVILGRQGSGKGTQCAHLVEQYGCIHVSTGDMLRSARAEGTELGRTAGELMDRGDLVPDETMNGIVAERLAMSDIVTNGVLLDGFPRTPDQAEALDAMFVGNGLDMAINIDVPVEVVTERMVARGRKDDTPEGIARRLELYEQQTSPLLKWFDAAGKLWVVDGNGSEDEVFARIKDVVDAL